MRKIIEGVMLAVVILCLIVGAWIAYLTLAIIGRGWRVKRDDLDVYVKKL